MSERGLREAALKAITHGVHLLQPGSWTRIMLNVGTSLLNLEAPKLGFLEGLPKQKK